jgi:hypothetical protein
MEAIQILCLRFYLSTHAHSCFGGFFSIVLAHFLHSAVFINNLIGQGIFHGDQDFLSLNCPQCKKRCSAWHKSTNILLFFLKIVILGFYAGKSLNLIGLEIFHGDLNFFDL